MLWLIQHDANEYRDSQLLGTEETEADNCTMRRAGLEKRYFVRQACGGGGPGTTSHVNITGRYAS